MAREQFSGHLDMLLLAALGGGPLHGYAIIDHIRSTSADRFDYAEGTVYPALHRLEREGLLRSRWVDVDGRRRRAYDLTARGRRALDGRRKDWEQFAASVQAVLNQ
ncbi:MAG: PadR family transcriptional regulator, regulatory protein PadR [Gaiellaceae bacterium]|jgi:PadR family transcriptional regulator PadR|nr:PadR family transcriptional regulator, regulatory protein PadR [Gaiellaceae bacterium]